jgi:hypothetical protein
MHRFSGSLPTAIALVLAASATFAQRGPAPDPLVRENATVKLAAHTYVIPDANVGLVPNVGIHVTAIFAMAFFRMPWPASGA